MNYYSSIFAHGYTFDVDAFLVSTTLDVSHVWRASESRHCRTNGVEFDLAQGQELDVAGQEEAAAQFIENNLEALKCLRQFPGLSAFIVGIRWSVDLTEDLVGFAVSFSPRLSAATARSGIEPVAYVDLKRPSE